MKKLFLLVIITLFIYSCKKQISDKEISKTKIEKSKQEVIPNNESSLTLLTDSIQKDTVETYLKNVDYIQNHVIEIDSSLVNYSYDIHDYVLYEIASFNYKDTSILIPFLLNHQEIYYTENDYPNELELRSIPNSIDTLLVVSGKSNCYDCLNLLKIENNQEKELFYQYTMNENNEVLIQKGELDTILNKRKLTIDDLKSSKFIVSKNDNWINDSSYWGLPDYLENEYIYSVNLKYLYLPTIYQANKSVGSKLIKKFKVDTYPLDTIKSYYQNILEKEDVITIDNLLSNNGGQKYFHSGDIGKNESLPNILLLVDSIRIYYISNTNKIYTINYLKNRTEYLTNNNAPLDDNDVEVIDNNYKINDWSSRKMINLFHQDMVDGEYIVIYQLKPKYIDTYIYSPIKIINYKKLK